MNVAERLQKIMQRYPRVKIEGLEKQPLIQVRNEEQVERKENRKETEEEKRKKEKKKNEKEL